VPDAKLWSPDAPHLYDLEVTVLDQAGQIIDQVRSYAGIRTVGVQRDDDGHLRFTLNGQALFHWGPLDQGWWPDGLLTPPSDAAMKSDIEFLKSAGFNMIRKHIKVEPRRYYYHCDRLGMLMWQDHVSALKNPPWTTLRVNPTDAQWTDAEHAQFMREFAEMVDALDHFPCIVAWVPFNEAWGQHRTLEVGQWILERDPSRLVNIASGGNFWPVGHVVDAHHYPHPQFPFQPERFRDYVHVMGEFGGHGWPTPGHLWDDSPRNWGYGGLPQSLEEYEARYRQSIAMLKDLKARGISGGVYTQTTDVEGEINGLLTYDRKVQKLAPEKLREIHRGLVD
jgi:beta-galactosidase